MIARLAKLLAVNVAVFLGLLVMMEVILQGVALIWPAYDVLFLQPEKVVGWKQVPNLRWRWAGSYWYASDFSTDVTTNDLGFRDFNRTLEAPSNVKRVALLGDSFIEAVQVPLERTAAQQLERLLNAADSAPQAAGKSRWQVLNFGISNFGVGQYLLTWNQYASQFKPDYVAIFVAKLHMRRTVSRYEEGAFSKSGRLWIRPSFRMEGDHLVLEPARDFDAFVDAQRELVTKEFGGQRSRKKTQLITLFYARQIKETLAGLLHRDGRSATSMARAQAAEEDANLLAVNLQLIKELGKSVASHDAKLIVLDASGYFGDGDELPSALKKTCSDNGIGYVPVYEDLLREQSKGIAIHWPHDGHFNDRGNQILADAIHSWIDRQLPPRVAAN